MAYSFSREYAKFEKERERIEKILKCEGADEKTSEKILEMYRESFLEDMSYRRKMADVSLEDAESAGIIGRKVCCCEETTVKCSRFWWIDEIEDEALLKGLKKCSDDELSIIDALAFSGLSQSETARKLNCSQGTVSKNLQRIRGKINASDFRS